MMCTKPPPTKKSRPIHCCTWHCTRSHQWHVPCSRRNRRIRPRESCIPDNTISNSGFGNSRHPLVWPHRKMIPRFGPWYYILHPLKKKLVAIAWCSRVTNWLEDTKMVTPRHYNTTIEQKAQQVSACMDTYEKILGKHRIPALWKCSWWFLPERSDKMPLGQPQPLANFGKLLLLLLNL